MFQGFDALLRLLSKDANTAPLVAANSGRPSKPTSEIQGAEVCLLKAQGMGICSSKQPFMWKGMTMMTRLYIGLGAGLIFLSAEYFAQTADILKNMEQLAHIAIPAVLALGLLKDVIHHMIGNTNRKAPLAHRNHRKAISRLATKEGEPAKKR